MLLPGGPVLLPGGPVLRPRGPAEISRWRQPPVPSPAKAIAPRQGRRKSVLAFNALYMLDSPPSRQFRSCPPPILPSITTSSPGVEFDERYLW